MRLLEQMKITVTVKPAAAPQKVQENDRLYRFDGAGAFTVRAVLQPLSARSELSVQGQTAEGKLLMLYDGDKTLDEGMGVCVDADANTACDYRISEMPRRYQSHKEFMLAFIPPEQRG
jgi:hypothetical protein